MERLRTGAGRRTLGLGFALLIEGLLLLALLSLGPGEQPGTKEPGITVLNLEAAEISQEAPDPEREQRAEKQAEERPVQQPVPPPPVRRAPPPPQPAERKPVPVAPATVPAPQVPPPAASIPARPVRPATPGSTAYGPPDKGGRSASRDTERVGTAPNGEPLYAAAWYREPRPDELRAYLSTANGPGWGLIACRTAPDYRVEDCVGLDEYPQGSQITRAVLAAAWEFQVRPPSRGGRPLVGSWVRIRIVYGIERR